MTLSLPVAADGRGALEVARAALAEGRAIVREAFGRVGVAAVKGRGNVLTEADLAVERTMSAALRAAFPDHAILSEETAATTRSEGWMWVLDPIDGTKNFAQGIPHFAINLALCHGGEPVLALTLQPLTGEEFSAIRGEGAQLDGRPVAVSGCASVAASVFAMDMGYDDAAAKRQLDTVFALWPGMQSLRVQGSAALGLAYVAAGRTDIYLQPSLAPWDLAAGLLLVREAGGLVTRPDGTPATIFDADVVAATPAVHADYLRLVRARAGQA
ncbi:MAG: inositol monophosphatase [Dehalococcoidia bacterium]|nr:inositol monophosphatase [Dehalococcoidia bacterium]